MNRKRTTFFVMTVIVVVGFICFSQLHFSPQFSPFGLASNAEINEYEEINSQFDVDTTKGGSIYILEKKDKWDTYSDFKLLEKISDDFKKILKTDVHSLANLTMPAKGMFGFTQRPILRLKTKAEFDISFRKLQKMDFAKSKFVSNNDKYALLFIDGVKNINESKSKKLIKSIGVCKGFIYSGSNQKNETKDLIAESISIGLIALLLVLIGFYFMTKSLKGIPLIGLVILFNMAVSFIFMYVFGMPFSMNMIAIPCLLVILSFSDLMHIFHYQTMHAKEFESDAELKKNMLSRIGLPMIFTSVSNLLGFIVYLFLSENEMLTQLALVSIFGVVAAYLSSRFLVVPMMDRKTVYIKRSNLSNFGGSLLTFGNKLRKNRKLVMLATVLVFIIASVFLFRTFKVDLEVGNYVSKRSTNYSAGKILTSYFFGSKSGEIVVHLKDSKDIWSYEHQSKIELIEKEVKSIFQPLHLTSSNSLVKRFSQISVNGNPNAYRLMKHLNPNEISPYVNELGGRRIVSKDQKTTRVRWGFEDEGIPENLEKFTKVEKRLSSIEGLNLDFEIVGKSLMADTSVVYYSKRIIWGLLSAVFLTSLIILFYVKSVRLSLGTILVNGIPLVICLLLMLNSNIQINPQSLFLLSVLAGLCLDDSIYLMGYRSKKVDELVLFPISVTTVVLGLAFFSLIFSSYKWLQDFSIIFIVGLGLAFVLDVFVFPHFMNLSKEQDGE